jgi:hypothetical protein
MSDNDRVATLLAFVSTDDRVCPRPIEWNRLYELIGGKMSAWEPPPPLILAAWGYASDDEKAARLREHIEWAAANGMLDVAEKFLMELPVEGWHHSNPLKLRY